MAEYEKGRAIERDAAAGARLLSMGIGKKGEDGVVLEWPEAAFLVERKLIEVREGKKALALEDFLAEPKEREAKKAPKAKQAKTNLSSSPSRADQYRIYRALRGGGRVVRFSAGSPLHWRVYERGVGREQERPQMMLCIVPPDWSVSLQTLEQQMQLARLLRLDLGLAFVREGKPQMVKLSRPPLEG